MQLSNKHKAILLTVLISGTVVLTVFNFGLKKQNAQLAETYYELEPEKTKETADKKSLDNPSEKLSETNKAFNETQKYKRYAKAYQPIAPPKDYEFKSSESNINDNNTDEGSSNSSSEIDDDVLSSYNSVNDVLNKRRSGVLGKQSVNKNSSMHYSLVNRTHKYVPTPIYLCENGGKIIVNIKVNASGLVTDSYINAAYASANECLKDQALKYANQARFSIDASKKTQLGSITFYFKGKN